MIGRRRRPLDARDRSLLVAAVALFAGAWLLDAARDAARLDAPPAIVAASVFAFIWQGLQLLAGYLATAATVTVTYLATVVSWLAGRVATFLISTGSVFAKVWEGMRVVWRDVLRPALVWVDKGLRRLHDFLQRTFAPILKWLTRVRDRFFDLYRKFVRPVLDTIDFIRALDKLLLAFHIHLLEGLDRILTQIEAYVNEQFFRVLRVLNRVQDVIDRIVDLDGFFQRYALIASLRKYSAPWMQNFWRDQVRPGGGGATGATGATTVEPRKPEDDAADLAAYFDEHAGDRAALIDELAADVMRIAELRAPLG